MEPSPTAPATPLEFLSRDRFILLFLAAVAIVAAVYAVPLLPGARLAEFGEAAFLIPFIAIITIAAFDGLHRIAEPNERRFWILLGLGFAAWLVTLLATSAIRSADWAITYDVAFDAAYLVVYAPLLMAFEYRPHVPPARLPRQIDVSRQLRWIGLTCLFLGWFSYFVVVPIRFDPSYYESLVPSALLYLTADTMLVIRLVMTFVVTPSRRWRRIYGTLGVAAVALLVTDAIEAAGYTGLVTLPSGTWVDFTWVVPPFVFLAAVRLRDLPAESAPAALDEARDLEPERAGTLLLSAAASFPIANVAQQSVADLARPLERAQDSVALLGMLTMAAVAAAAYYVLERDRVAAERAHDALETRLREAGTLAAISRLAAVSAREVGEPLSIARSSLDRLQDLWPATLDGRDSLVSVRAGLDRLHRFSQTLRALSRQLPLRPAPLDLNGAILELEPSIRDFVWGPVTLDLRLTPEAGRVLADPAALRDALLTLAENAREAMPNGGTLTIETGRLQLKGRQAVARAIRPGLYGQIVVRDTGMGMSRDMVAHAFEPFYGTRDTGHGRGLGLASVHAAIAQHGGTIDVESESGAGTRFEILLPLDPRG